MDKVLHTERQTVNIHQKERDERAPAVNLRETRRERPSPPTNKGEKERG